MSVIKKYLKAEFGEGKPFKDREEVKAEIRECDRFAAITQNACFIFVILGVVGDALNLWYGSRVSSSNTNILSIL